MGWGTELLELYADGAEQEETGPYLLNYPDLHTFGMPGIPDWSVVKSLLTLAAAFR